jgi:aminoglycoside phosphotransferase family enzyme
MSSLSQDLLDPDALPDKTQSVSLVQTHISMVFVAEKYVYKIKKPVDFGFLDFRTLEKRAYYCLQEVALNRRLAKDIYLDVLPVRFDGTRHSMRAKVGEIVDHAVKMKRIPEEQLMKSVFERGDLTEAHLQSVASVLARFHTQARTSPEIAAYGDAENFKVNTDENFQQVEKYVGTAVDRAVFEALREWTESFYRSNQSLFRERVAAGRIRDCHGDLHMEHVCLTENLQIIDCIEFNDRFRYSDTIADIAFLLMDLDYHGGEDFSRFLWQTYKGEASEKDVEPLLDFYKVYRAFVRGKVNSFRLDDAHIGDAEKAEAAQRAKKYFELAFSYVQTWRE